MSYVADKFDNEIIRFLKQGGIGLLPSDTIYGLSGQALNESVVERVRKLKGRTAGKSFIVLISSIEMLNMLGISIEQAKLIEKYWPGSLSVVLEASKAPEWLRAPDGTLAVRLPNYPELTALIDKTGPLISTSANLQGHEPVKNVREAEELFGDKLDFYVDAGELDNPPSTLASVIDGKLKVIRQGSIDIKN